MRITTKRGRLWVFLGCLFFLALAPPGTSGKVLLETDVATGVVANISGNEITLDSGEKFYPARDGLVPDIDVGDTVTLRFFTDGEKKNRFIEIVAGKNSLSKTAAVGEMKGGFK